LAKPDGHANAGEAGPDDGHAVMIRFHAVMIRFHAVVIRLQEVFVIHGYLRQPRLLVVTYL
jgi:hypothetical protein